MSCFYLRLASKERCTQNHATIQSAKLLNSRINRVARRTFLRYLKLTLHFVQEWDAYAVKFEKSVPPLETAAFITYSWWRHQMETLSALLALCAGNSLVTGGEFLLQRPVMRSFDVFFHLRLNKRLANNRKAGDLRSHRGHYDVTVMSLEF